MDSSKRPHQLHKKLAASSQQVRGRKFLKIMFIQSQKRNSVSRSEFKNSSHWKPACKLMPSTTLTLSKWSTINYLLHNLLIDLLWGPLPLQRNIRMLRPNLKALIATTISMKPKIASNSKRPPRKKLFELRSSTNLKEKALNRKYKNSTPSLKDKEMTS